MGNKLVYSTESGDLRQEHGKKKKGKPNSPPARKSDGIVRVQRESKGRAGKTVTVIYGLNLHLNELNLMASGLKQKCGTGGTVKDRTIIIQGDKTQSVMDYLKAKGFNVKRSGG